MISNMKGQNRGKKLLAFPNFEEVGNSFINHRSDKRNYSGKHRIKRYNGNQKVFGHIIAFGNAGDCFKHAENGIKTQKIDIERQNKPPIGKRCDNYPGDCAEKQGILAALFCMPFPVNQGRCQHRGNADYQIGHFAHPDGMGQRQFQKGANHYHDDPFNRSQNKPSDDYRQIGQLKLQEIRKNRNDDGSRKLKQIKNKR